MNLRDPKTQIVAVIVLLFLGLYYLWFAKVYTPFQAQIVAKEVQKGNLLTQLHKVEEKAATLTELQKEYGDLLVKYKKVEVLLRFMRPTIIPSRWKRHITVWVNSWRESPIFHSSLTLTILL
jgi:hypothetical protein